jgi:hypothetical protein
LAATNRIVMEALKTQTNPTRTNEINFSVVDLAAQQGWESAIVKRELKNLQWQVGGGKAQVSFKFYLQLLFTLVISVCS